MNGMGRNEMRWEDMKACGLLCGLSYSSFDVDFVVLYCTVDGYGYGYDNI